MFLKVNTADVRPMPPAGAAAAAMAEIASARDGQTIWAHLVRCMAQHGFEAVNYGFTRYRHDSGIGDPRDALFLSSAPGGVIDTCFRKARDPENTLFRWIAENVGAVSWGEVAPCAAAGAQAGYTLAFPETTPREKGAMALAARAGLSQATADEIWEAHGQTLWALATLAHLRLSQLPMGSRDRWLTDRQREVLEWVADGKTAQDIQVLTGLSISGVEKHLRRVREVLMVETTAHAVAKATLMNQLFVRPNG